MAFWGVELRPGRPYTHRYQPSHGRLRISKAALVSCDAATRTIVKCTLGNRTPIILCSLNPRMAEMCHLDVEFEENVDVLFSVLGPSSVHLSGYYLRSSTSNINIALDQQSSESYGEDIEASDSEYPQESEEESYESDFIDDGDLKVSNRKYVNTNIALDQQSSKSYGEDIEASDSEYLQESEEESYESDFIDDGDLEVSDKKYVIDSIDDGDVCSSPAHNKQAFELQRRLEKKHPADNSDDNTADSPYMPTNKGNHISLFYSSSSSSEDESF